MLFLLLSGLHNGLTNTEAWFNTSLVPDPELDPRRKVLCHYWDQRQGWVCEQPVVVRAGSIQRAVSTWLMVQSGAEGTKLHQKVAH